MYCGDVNCGDDGIVLARVCVRACAISVKATCSCACLLHAYVCRCSSSCDCAELCSNHLISAVEGGVLPGLCFKISAFLLPQVPLLEAGDIIIDGGNSEYRDTTVSR